MKEEKEKWVELTGDCRESKMDWIWEVVTFDEFDWSHSGAKSGWRRLEDLMALRFCGSDSLSKEGSCQMITR